MPDFAGASRSLVAGITDIWRKYTPDYDVSDKRTTEREPETGLYGSGSSGVWEANSRFFNLKQSRNFKYKDFEEMDTDVVEISSGLDLYADFVVGGAQDTDETYSFDSENVPDNVKKVIADFEKRLELKQRVWWMSREVSKFGDAFYEVIATKSNVIKLQKLNVATIFYNFDNKGKLDLQFPYCQKEYEGAMQNIATFAPWEIIHFKMGEEMYGVDSGILSKLRRLYRVERMLEDSMLINRLTRAHQRLVYNVDVSNMGVIEAINFIRKLKRLNRRRRYVDSDGKWKQEENPMAPQEDIFNPVRKGGVGGID